MSVSKNMRTHDFDLMDARCSGALDRCGFIEIGERSMEIMTLVRNIREHR